MDLYSTPFLNSWPKLDLEKCFEKKKEKKKILGKKWWSRESEFVEIIKSFFFLLAKSH